MASSSVTAAERGSAGASPGRPDGFLLAVFDPPFEAAFIGRSDWAVVAGADALGAAGALGLLAVGGADAFVGFGATFGAAFAAAAVGALVAFRDTGVAAVALVAAAGFAAGAAFAVVAFTADALGASVAAGRLRVVVDATLSFSSRQPPGPDL